MFDWTVKLSTDKDDYYYALDATDYSLIKEYAYKDMRRSVPGLSFTSLMTSLLCLVFNCGLTRCILF